MSIFSMFKKKSKKEEKRSMSRVEPRNESYSYSTPYDPYTPQSAILSTLAFDTTPIRSESYDTSSSYSSSDSSSSSSSGCD